MTDPQNLWFPRSPGAAQAGSRPPAAPRLWSWLIAGVTAFCGIALALIPIHAQDASDAAVAGASSSQVYDLSLNPAPTAGAESLATWEQTTAVAKAKDYLSLMAFSRTGLIDQLEYEGFSTADATYAVSEIEAAGAVDWNEQAAKKARDYRSMMAFSRQGLIEQLEYEGFTPAQAMYGVDNA